MTTPMNEYELIGDYYEMGRQFATQLQRADRSVRDTSPETLDPPDENALQLFSPG